ncbi:hypothetical protein Smar_1402 [Staphylothermus marinus F1]|uniref:Uncharacterized protein n=1 Tax=Staphylothermus marinus (strain ATCC 43588 / DSM 3639 / JCM 9404 / F1) TaxID=399550 RepID=A3DPD3_STAMF|nr:hypothetical protein [Staphylothermus marinus]ABN70493.1 hypothetical protein Smar_1402 [Staphylothermus marinus F1]
MSSLTGETSKILKKVLPTDAEIIYDKGGATLVYFKNNPYIRYFFIGKNTTKYTGEFYYITISVLELDEQLENIGYVDIIVKKGILGLGKKLLLSGKGKLKDIVDKLIEKLRDQIFSTKYEEIILKTSGKLVLVDKEIKPSKGSSIVLVGRTRVFYTLTPASDIKKMFLLNEEFLKEVYSSLYQ